MIQNILRRSLSWANSLGYTRKYLYKGLSLKYELTLEHLLSQDLELKLLLIGRRQREAVLARQMGSVEPMQFPGKMVLIRNEYVPLEKFYASPSHIG